MKLVKYIFIFALTIISLEVSAQTKTNVFYGMALPMGDTKDYINPASFRGANIEFEKFVNPSIGVGLLVGWNTFYEAKDRATQPLPSGNGEITSNEYRYLNAIPIQATGKYYFADDDAVVRPFVGIAAGTYYMEQRRDNGLFSTSDKGWTWSVAPKAGLLVPVNYRTSLAISVDYSTSFKSSDVPQQNWLGINIGFSWDY
ncbi:outer membrane beta-barrel protein [Carboxylicivirga sediminis]|uniref:Outer membrane beta-barrel protein n=1 Tax=Carboxylicivirga sediminis TaxID=2006564 RepID=A0A941J0U0_9BACT|nr:OmpW family outer membrane protein [Carboxylicivirga sediminis]MBR8537537.1 outer membrane beta-barrel protein [Carboxylicivirga sediminis]